MTATKLVGQKAVFESLSTLIKEGQMPHSQLFIDNNGYGGLPLAMALATILTRGHTGLEKGAVWEHPDVHMFYPTIKTTNSNPIDFNSAWKEFCTEAPYGSINDWLEKIDSENKQGSIRVEAVAEIQKQAYLKPYAGKNKVLLLWGVDLLLSAAANKLLKLLEEPPANTYFLLVCEQTDGLLPTLLSRCQQTLLKQIAEVELIEAAKAKFGEDVASKWVRNAAGSWRQLEKTLLNRDAETELEALWVSGLRLAFKAKGNKKIVLDLFEWSQQLARLKRESQKAFIRYGLDLIRNALMVNYQAEGLHRFNSFTGFDLHKFAPYIHASNILELQHLLEESHRNLGQNANAKILFTTFGLELSRLLNKKESGLSE